MTSNIEKVGKLEFLRSAWAILIGAGLGAYIGLYASDYVTYVAPVGSIYLDILKMCILPILLSAISLSIGRLVSNHGDTQYLKRMTFVFVIGVLVASILGTLAGAIGEPGKNLGDESLAALGSIIQNSGDPDLEIDLFKDVGDQAEASLFKEFFLNLVPSNIFHALSSGSNLKVLFFALLFGFAIGAVKTKTSEHLLTTLDAIYATFSKLVQWLMYLLPFGLCGLVATSLSEVGSGVLVAMMKFVPIAIISFVVLFFIVSCLMWWRTGSFLKPLKALREPLMIAFGTANGLASLPVTLQDH